MKNFEKIKQMNIDEMAEWLHEKICNNDCYFDWHCDECIDKLKQWLEAESK